MTNKRVPGILVDAIRKGNVYSYKQAFELCLSLAQEGEKQKEETKRGRGHPPIYSDSLYTSFPLFGLTFSLPYRETEALLAEFFPPSPFPAFQALHWFFEKESFPFKVWKSYLEV